MATTSPSTFGALLKRYRLAAGLTQEALAERAGVSARGVQDLERGIHTAPRAETIRLLAEALALDAETHAALVAAAYPEVVVPAATPAVRPGLPAPPVPATALVGREREVAEACAMLRHAGRATGTRLLTLTGPGGVGKTRLALAVVAELAEAFADGVAWIDLAPLHDPELVAATAARVLGVREEGDEPLRDTLVAAVAGRRLLLVFDNFEHLLPAAPFVAELLAAAPQLSVLVTSRTRLRLRGERELAVSPLEVPAASTDLEPPLHGLVGMSAVRLFVERASEVRPGFAVTGDNAVAVAEICQRLDGLPLALELAAARLKLLPPSALLQRLEARLPLLTGGARDLPLRQQTMRDTIAWSHDLLSAEEQRLFRRLAVFSGGFTLEAAEWVAGSQGGRVTGKTAPRHPDTPTPRHPDTPSVLDGVASLLDQSLLRPADWPGGDPCYAMLETIREYGLEQLEASDEAEAVRWAHATYYLALAELAEPELTGPAQAAWLDRLEDEHANVRAALNWSLANDQLDTARRLIGALWHFWQVRGHVAEGRAWAESALARDDQEPTVARAKALRAAASLAEYHGDYDQAVARHEAAAAVWRELGDERNLARTLDHLGNCAHDRGHFAQAAVLHEEALALARKVGDQRGIASALGNLGIMAIHLGQLESARQRLEEALALMRELNHAHGVGLALSQLGIVAVRQGDVERAVALNEEALAVWQELGDQDEAATTLISLGVAMRLTGDLAGARANVEEARRSLEHLGNKRATAVALEALASVADQQGDDRHAAEFFAAGLILAQEVDDKVTIAACLEGLAGLAAEQGQADRAVVLLSAAAALREMIAAPVAAHLHAGYDRIVSLTRAGVDAVTFEKAWQAGRELPLEEAIAAARNVTTTTFKSASVRPSIGDGELSVG